MNSTRADRGFTLVELLIVVAVIGIIAAIAVPGLRRARVVANEASAVAALRAVVSAQEAYQATCAQGYAASMAELATSPVLGGGPPFISKDLGADTVTKDGYQLTYSPGPLVSAAAGSCTGLPGPVPVGNFTYAAAPLSGNGTRYFGTNENRTIFEDSAPVTFTPPPTRTPSGSSVPLK